MTTAAMDDKRRVLIVDDTPESIWFQAEALKDLFRVQMARDGAAALALLNKGGPLPDLILLDVQMPGLGGHEVCQRLRENPATRDIPVIFVTSTASPEDESRGLQAGGADYIHKPFSPDILRARVQNTLAAKEHSDTLHHMVQTRTQSLFKTQQGIIMMMADMAEWRDPETGQHIRRTQEYMVLLARFLAGRSRDAAMLPPQIIELMRTCAPLHDVGKVGIPDGILLKPDKLTETEFATMKQHTVYGAQILQKAIDHVGENPFLKMAYDVARWHHERWDGKGYPDGLAGDRIPLSARVMTVADVYDALVSRRPYKEPFSHETAMELITADSGSRFDPDIINAFVVCQEALYAIAMQYSESGEPS